MLFVPQIAFDTVLTLIEAACINRITDNHFNPKNSFTTHRAIYKINVLSGPLTEVYIYVFHGSILVGDA